MFMDKIDDAVLIFDRSRKLMDLNRSAKERFPFLCGMSTAEDLFGYFNRQSDSVVPMPVLCGCETDPFEFMIRDGSGIRYLRCCVTNVRDADEAHAATVMTFYDVTEKDEAPFRARGEE
jgi:hypothetical protein